MIITHRIKDMIEIKIGGNSLPFRYLADLVEENNWTNAVIQAINKNYDRFGNVNETVIYIHKED
jgi:hypothetical protein